MPKTKLQNPVFSALMVFCMVYCMTTYNIARQMRTLRITKSRTEHSHSVRLFAGYLKPDLFGEKNLLQLLRCHFLLRPECI